MDTVFTWSLMRNMDGGVMKIRASHIGLVGGPVLIVVFGANAAIFMRFVTCHSSYCIFFTQVLQTVYANKRNKGLCELKLKYV